MIKIIILVFLLTLFAGCENKYNTVELSSINPVDTASQNSITQFKSVSPNREIVKNQFEDLFLSSSKILGTDTTIKNIIKKYVTDKPESFGGSCSRYDEDCVFNCGIYGYANCVTLHQISTTALPNPEYSTLTKGNKILLCEEIVSNETAIRNLLSKVNLLETDLITETNLRKIIQYVNRYKSVDPVIVESLLKIKTEADENTNFSLLKKWQFVILPICVSNLTDHS